MILLFLESLHDTELLKRFFFGGQLYRALTIVHGGVQKAGQESEQRASELSALQLQHTSLRSTHKACLKELDVVHSSHSSAAKRAEEALAELALVRGTQQALTNQVCLPFGPT